MFNFHGGSMHVFKGLTQLCNLHQSHCTVCIVCVLALYVLYTCTTEERCTLLVAMCCCESQYSYDTLLYVLVGVMDLFLGNLLHQPLGLGDLIGFMGVQVKVRL